MDGTRFSLKEKVDGDGVGVPLIWHLTMTSDERSDSRLGEELISL